LYRATLNGHFIT